MNKLTMVVDIFDIEDINVERHKIEKMLKEFFPDIDHRIIPNNDVISSEDAGIDFFLTIQAYEYDDGDISLFTHVGIEIEKFDGSKSIEMQIDEKIRIDENRIYAGIHDLLEFFAGSNAIDTLI